MDAVGRNVLEGLYYLLPNLERFNLKGHVTHNMPVPVQDFGLIVAYGLAYTTLLLMLAGVIFQRRDFR
jgi:hypothetical protein